jgi:hypothetical protein
MGVNMMKLAGLSILVILTGCVEKGRAPENELRDIYRLSQQIKPRTTTKQEVKEMLGTPVQVKNLKKNHSAWLYEWDSESEVHRPLQKTAVEVKSVSHKEVDIVRGKCTSLEIRFDEKGRVESFDFIENTGKIRHAFVGND